MNLYPKIEKAFKHKISGRNARSVLEVWEEFKNTLEEVSLAKHKNVDIYYFNSECSFIDGTTYLSIGIEYILNYLKEDERYEHTEYVSCQFKIPGKVGLNKDEKYAGIEKTSDIFSLEDMFMNIESWKPFKMFNEQYLEFEVYAEEI